MRLLLDECVPRPLKKAFGLHEVSTIEDAGFKGLKNGTLLRFASQQFDVLITVDKNIEHQQNIEAIDIAIMVLSAYSNKLEDLLRLMPAANKALETVSPGEIKKIEVLS